MNFATMVYRVSLILLRICVMGVSWNYQSNFIIDIYCCFNEDNVDLNGVRLLGILQRTSIYILFLCFISRKSIYIKVEVKLRHKNAHK